MLPAIRNIAHYSCIATGITVAGTGAIGAVVGFSVGVREVKSHRFCKKCFYPNSRGIDRAVQISATVLQCTLFGAITGPYVAAEKVRHIYESFKKD